jgi:hypothetical protein
LIRPIVEDVWAQRYRDRRQRGWLRVTAYAEAHQRDTGHCPLTAGELGRALDLDPQAVSRAIRTAVAEGWLHPCSTARCLVLDRADPNAPCPAIHRDGR